MQWLELQVHTNTQGSDMVSQLFIELEATGTEIVDREDVIALTKSNTHWELFDDTILEGMPEDVLVKGWFEVNERTNDLVTALHQALEPLKNGAFGTLDIECKNVADEDWAHVWKKYYKPFSVGKRLVVKPSWEDYIPKEGEVIVELDPGMAFGTGTHETTFMCMALLDKYIKPNSHVMDIGTGSGILAIASAKLGAEKVLAIDIDADAVKVAKENAVRNNVEDKIKVIEGDLVKGESLPCNIAVANIVADAICMLSKPVTRHLQKDGLFICSGIIRQREEDVQKALKEAGFIAVERMEKGEWVALCVKGS